MEKTDSGAKKVYESPRLTVHGTVEAITAGNIKGAADHPGSGITGGGGG